MQLQRSKGRLNAAVIIASLAATISSCSDQDGRSAFERAQPGYTEGNDFFFGEPCSVSVLTSGSVTGKLSDQPSLLCSTTTATTTAGPGFSFLTNAQPGVGPQAFAGFGVSLEAHPIAAGEEGEFPASVVVIDGKRRAYLSEDCSVRLQQTAVPEADDDVPEVYRFLGDPYRVTAEGSCRTPLRPYDGLTRTYLVDVPGQVELTPFSFSVVAGFEDD